MFYVNRRWLFSTSRRVEQGFCSFSQELSLISGLSLISELLKLSITPPLGGRERPLLLVMPLLLLSSLPGMRSLYSSSLLSVFNWDEVSLLLVSSLSLTWDDVSSPRLFSVFNPGRGVFSSLFLSLTREEEEESSPRCFSFSREEERSHRLVVSPLPGTWEERHNEAMRPLPGPGKEA